MRIRRLAAWALVPAAAIGAVMAPIGATAGGLGGDMTIDPTEVEVGPDTTEVAVSGTGCVISHKYDHDEATLTTTTPGSVDLTLNDPDGVTQDTAGPIAAAADGTWNSTLTLPANPQTGTWSVDGTCNVTLDCQGCSSAARRFVRTGAFLTYSTQFLLVTEAAVEDDAAEAIEAQPTFTG